MKKLIFVFLVMTCGTSFATECEKVCDRDGCTTYCWHGKQPIVRVPM